MSNTWKHFRRMLTGLLAAALIVTSVPAAAFADNLDVSNGDETQVVDEAAVNTTDTAETADAKTDGGVL